MGSAGWFPKRDVISFLNQHGRAWMGNIRTTSGDGARIRLGVHSLLQLLLRLLRGGLRQPHGGPDDAHVREAGGGRAGPQRHHLYACAELIEFHYIRGM